MEYDDDEYDWMAEMTDRRMTPSLVVLNTFKGYVAKWHDAKTSTTRNARSKDIDYYLKNYKDLEQFDTRNQAVSAPNNNAKNYVEIKVGGTTVKKQGDKLIVNIAESVDYNAANILQLKSTLANALDVIEAAAKFETNSTATSGVSI